MRPTRLLSTTDAARRLRALASVGLVAVTCGVAAAAAPAAAVSKGQLITRADDICRRVNTEAAPYQAQVTKLTSAQHPDYKRVAAVLNKRIAVEQTGLNQLRALPVPAADRTAVAKIWRELGAIVTASRQTSRAVADADITAVNQASQRTAGAETVYHRLAKRFGFKYCGS